MYSGNKRGLDVEVNIRFDKKEYPVVLSNILSTFIMYSGDKRGLYMKFIRFWI